MEIEKGYSRRRDADGGSCARVEILIAREANLPARGDKLSSNSREFNGNHRNFYKSDAVKTLEAMLGSHDLSVDDSVECLAPSDRSSMDLAGDDNPRARMRREDEERGSKMLERAEDMRRQMETELNAVKRSQEEIMGKTESFDKVLSRYKHEFETRNARWTGWAKEEDREELWQDLDDPAREVSSSSNVPYSPDSLRGEDQQEAKDAEFLQATGIPSVLSYPTNSLPSSLPPSPPSPPPSCFLCLGRLSHRASQTLSARCSSCSVISPNPGRLEHVTPSISRLAV
eukprot:757231-Hanusia_phi.AAC.6